MLTAEQARDMTVNNGMLEKAEKLIEYTAKRGERTCTIYVPYGEDYSSIGDTLEQRGFEVSYDNLYMIIEW